MRIEIVVRTIFTPGRPATSRDTTPCSQPCSHFAALRVPPTLRRKPLNHAPHAAPSHGGRLALRSHARRDERDQNTPACDGSSRCLRRLESGREHTLGRSRRNQSKDLHGQPPSPKGDCRTTDSFVLGTALQVGLVYACRAGPPFGDPSPRRAASVIARPSVTCL